MKSLYASIILTLFIWSMPARSQLNYLTELHIADRTDENSNAIRSASLILSEEIGKRTGLNIAIGSDVPASGNLIYFCLASSAKRQPFPFPDSLPLINKPESFRVFSRFQNNRRIIVVEGYDARGILFGAGYLLRKFIYAKGQIGWEDGLAISTSPDKPIRGHQLGYRNTANSYDAWSPAQFEQYIRDLIIFGTNSIESIPIFEEEQSPHFKLPPDEMNARISAICNKYGIDYWIWVPAQFDLKDSVKRRHYLDRIEMICKMSPRLNGVFFPGGDPGDNPPEMVLPLLEDMAPILKKYHPESSIWLSLQGFTTVQSQTVYKYIQNQRPQWLGGMVTGPSSPPEEETRAAIPANYKLLYYPDLTHNMRSDFVVPYWDPFFNFTLGREAVNPRPRHYAAIYHFLQPYNDGFISYSDGCHDDANKILWTSLAWDPNTTIPEAFIDYTNFFFGSEPKEIAADAIMALENNWEGSAATNGGIETTLLTWQKLEKEYPALLTNWRWQLYLLRAYYDAYARDRGMFEAGLEEKANNILREAQKLGPSEAMFRARFVLGNDSLYREHNTLRNRIIILCDSLFHSVGLQTSVIKYKASGEERGAVLDFIDFPLNNKWWMEDRFNAIEKLPLDKQISSLKEIANWEHPGPGSYYDDIGNIANSPHVLRGESWETDPLSRKEDVPNFDWWNNGFSRQRHSWMSSLRWPVGVEYNGLDSNANYLVRITGYGECLLKINGHPVAHTLYGKGVGEIKEFPIPHELIKGGKVSVGFEDINEDSINWRQQSRVTEIWLIKKPS